MFRKFEYDESKSEGNAGKHGIDFDEAQELWLDPDLLMLTARSDSEIRLMFIGKIGQKHWSAIVTPRGDALRIISVRRSRPREVQAYEGE